MIVAVVLGALAGLALLGVLALHRRVRALQSAQTDLEQRVSQFEQVYQGLSAGALGTGENLAKLKHDISRLSQRMEQVAEQSPGGEAFSQAIRFARKGMAAEEIAETCGLTQVEAELVVMLHRQREQG